MLKKNRGTYITARGIDLCFNVIVTCVLIVAERVLAPPDQREMLRVYPRLRCLDIPEEQVHRSEGGR